MGLTVDSGHSWDRTTAWLKKLQRGELFATLDKYGAMGAAALASATPTETGATAAGWSYEIKSSPGYFSIVWTNSYRENDFPVAIMLQYGHGTRQGGYVQGRDYINPAIRPIFDQIDAEVRRVVSE